MVILHLLHDSMTLNHGFMIRRNVFFYRLKDVFLDTASAGSTSDVMMSGVEKCSCPRGYSGLSCEVIISPAGVSQLVHYII